MSSGALFYIILDNFKYIEKNFDCEYGKVYKIKEIYDFSSQTFVYKELWNTYLNIHNDDPLLFNHKEWIYFNTNIMDISSNVSELQECYKMGTDGIIYTNTSCRKHKIYEFKNDTYYPVKDYIFFGDMSSDSSSNTIQYFKPEYGVLVYPKNHTFQGSNMYSEYEPNSFHTSIYPELNESLKEVHEYIKNKDYNTYTLSVFRGERNIERDISHNIGSNNSVVFRVKRTLRFRDVFNSANITELISSNINDLSNVTFYIINKEDQSIQTFTLDSIPNDNVLLHKYQRLKIENSASTAINIQLHKYLYPEKINKDDIQKTKEKMKKKKDESYQPPSDLNVVEGKKFNNAIKDVYDDLKYNDVFDTTSVDIDKVKKDKKRFEKEVIKEFLKDEVSDTSLGLKLVKGKFLGKQTVHEEKQYVIPKTNKIRKSQMKEYKDVYVPIDYDNPTMYYGPETFQYNGITYENAIIAIEMDKDEEFKYNGKIITNAEKINELYDSETDEIKLYFKENENSDPNDPNDNPFLFFKDVSGTIGISFEDCKILPEMKYRLENISSSTNPSKKMKLSDRKDDVNDPTNPKTDISGFDFNGNGIEKGEVIYFKKRREDDSLFLFDTNDNTNTTFEFPEYDEQIDNIDLFTKEEDGYTLEIKQQNDRIIFEIGSVTITVTDNNSITSVDMSVNEVKSQLQSGDLSNVQIEDFDISNISFQVPPNNIMFINSTIQGMDVSGIDLSGLTFDNSTNITGISGEPTNIALGYSIVDGIYYNRLIFEKVDISYLHYDVKIERAIWKLNNIETPIIYLKKDIPYQVDFSGVIDTSFDVFYSYDNLPDPRFPFGGSITNSNNMYNGIEGKIIMTDPNNAYYGHKTIHGMGGLQYHNIKVPTIYDEPLFGYPIHRQSSSQINDTSMNNMLSVSKKLCYEFEVGYERLTYNETCQVEPKREICINGHLRPKLVVNDNSYTIFEITNVYTPVYPDPDLSLQYVEQFIDLGLHNAPLTRQDISALIDISNQGTNISGVESINHWQYSSLIQLFHEKVFENNKYNFNLISAGPVYDDISHVVDISEIVHTYSNNITYPLYIGVDWSTIQIDPNHNQNLIYYIENGNERTREIELSNNNTIIQYNNINEYASDYIHFGNDYPSSHSTLGSDSYINIPNNKQQNTTGSYYKINPQLTNNVFDTINNYIVGFVLANGRLEIRIIGIGTWIGDTLTSILRTYPFDAYISTMGYYYFDMNTTYDVYVKLIKPTYLELKQLTNDIKDAINDVNINISSINDVFQSEYNIPEMDNYTKSNMLNLLLMANNEKDFFTKNDKDNKLINISDVALGEKLINKYGKFDIYTFSEYNKQKELYDINSTNTPEHFSNMLGDTYIIGPIDFIYTGMMRDINSNNWSLINVTSEKLDDICIQISRKRVVKHNNIELNDTNMLYYITRNISDISVDETYSYEIKQFDKQYRFKLSDDKTYYDVYEASPRIIDTEFVDELENDNIVTINTDTKNVIYKGVSFFNIDICYSAIDNNTNRYLYDRKIFTPLRNDHIVEFDGDEIKNNSLNYILNYHKKVGSTNDPDFSINVVENELYLFQMMYNNEEKEKGVYDHAPILYPYKQNNDIQYYYDINYMPKIGDPFKTNRLFHARKLVQYGSQAIEDKYYLSSFRHSLDICYNGHKIDETTNKYHSDLSESGSYNCVVDVEDNKIILTKNETIQKVPLEYIQLQGSSIVALTFDFSSQNSTKRWLSTDEYTGFNYSDGTITHVEIELSSTVNPDYDVSTSVLGFVYIDNNNEEQYMDISRVYQIGNNPSGSSLVPITDSPIITIESSYNRLEDGNIMDPDMFIIEKDASYNFRTVTTNSNISYSIDGYNLSISNTNDTYSFYVPSDFSDNVIISAENSVSSVDISDIILRSVNDDWKYTSPDDFSGCIIHIKENTDISKNLIVERKEYSSNSENFTIRESSHFKDDYDL